MIFKVLFWISVLALLHTYLLYPALLRILARRKSINRDVHESLREIPAVSVIMAVHNEQDVLEEKISGIIDNNIPEGKLEILVGSDASTDNSDMILENLARSVKSLRYVLFDKRMGKSAIINELAGLARSGVLIITDANVMFEKDTIFHLLKHFKNSETGLVDTNMKHKGLRENGISIQENAYISREVRIKYLEGIIWGTMMGPFGGCYALKSKLYCNVPPTFLVDDFFINMKVISSGHRSIIEPEAVVYEDVSNSLGEEFRRKVRIAAGNFQNLKYFSGYVFSGRPGLSFSYISHKVLRWLGPFFLAAIFICSLYLGRQSSFYKYLFIAQLFILILPLIDYILGKIKIHVIILRFVTHFVSMNFALMAGFVKFLRGVKTNVWEPTRRNQ